MAEIDVRGTRFHYQRLGQGPQRVVFLHGFIWDNLASWYFTAGMAVAREAEVLLYDLRGHGKSAQPPTGYRVEDMVEDLAAILDATGFGDRPVHLVGNSVGGLLALAFAIAYPERVASLVLVDAHIADASWATQMMASLQAGGQERDREIIRLFREWSGRYKDPRQTRLAKSAERLVADTSLLRDIACSGIVSDQDLARVSCPVLALYGEHSDLRAKGERLAAVLPDCELEILLGGSHVILLEETSGLKERILAWLALQPDRRPLVDGPGR
jgi:pimeloyl-ACP methyl ester carboxylesterase